MRSSTRKRLSKIVPTSGSARSTEVSTSSFLDTPRLYARAQPAAVSTRKHAKDADHRDELLAERGQRGAVCPGMSVESRDVHANVSTCQLGCQGMRLLVRDHVVVHPVHELDAIRDPRQVRRRIERARIEL